MAFMPDLGELKPGFNITSDDYAPANGFLFQCGPVWKEGGILLNKCTGNHQIRAIIETAGDDDTLIQPSHIPL
jgi:hypothetical protein